MALAALVLALFFLECLGAARRDSQTSDEAVTIASGYAYLRTGRVLLNPEHPMLGKALIALPLLALGPELETRSDAWRHGEEWVAAYEFLWENPVAPGRILRAARLPVSLCGAALLALVFAAGWKLYGPVPAFGALLLGASCPDLLAHAHLATLDVPLALGAFATLIALEAYARRPSRARHLLLSLLLGLTLATKISALQLLPALFVAAVVRALGEPRRLEALYRIAGGLLVATVYGALVLWASYLGAPEAYLAGLERNALLAGYGHPTYLLGELSSRGFPEYFLVALGVKLPLVLIALGLAGAASLVLFPGGRDDAGGAEALGLSFAAVLFLLASFAPAQTGVRYLLPLYPVLFLCAGRALLVFPPAVAAVAIACAATVVSARPLYLSYTNALAARPEQAIGVLADSNLDWGQDLGRLAQWLEARGNPPIRLAFFGNAPPEAYGIRYQALPAAGPVLPPRRELLAAGSPAYVALSANNLLGLFFTRDVYGWLRARRPAAIVGGSVWVYELAGPADHLRLAAVYEAFDWPHWAAHERALGGVRE